VSVFDASGKRLWDCRVEGATAINALACVDVDGDGTDEVVFGSSGAGIGLLSASGKRLWQTVPPLYRGIPGDVMTVFPAT